MAEVFDFAVVVCASVPCLKKSVKLFKEDNGNVIPNPEHFEKVDYEKVLVAAKCFKEFLSKQILLSSFSYFEAYVADCCRELLEFQRERLKSHFDRKKIMQVVSDPKFLNSKRKLQDNYTPHKSLSYKKHTQKLRDLGYAFPKDIFASHAIRRLLSATKDENIKANDIPEFLRDVLLLDLDIALLCRNLF